MTLITEDGTGKVDAESYATVAEADTRLAAFGNTAWAAYSTSAKEIRLRIATDYMVNTYRSLWKGYRTNATQALDWPRTYVDKPDALGGYSSFPNYYDDDEIPTEIKSACIDLAARADDADTLAPDIERVERKVKVGPIEVEYEPNSAAATIYRAIETKLRPFLSGGGMMTRLVRS